MARGCSGNVFYRAYHSALWVGKTCQWGAVAVTGNLALETLFHPLGGHDPMAAFLLEVPLLTLRGNLAAGSTEGFVQKKMKLTKIQT